MDPIVILNGIQMNPPADDGTGISLEDDGIQGWYGTPKPKSAFTQRTSDAGSWWSPLAFEDVRTIIVNGTLIGADTLTFLQAQLQLSAICPDPSQLYLLQVTDDSGTFTATVQRSDAVLVKPLSNIATAFSMSLTAPDPLKYDLTPNNAGSIVLASATGGLDWTDTLDWSDGLDWGDSSSDGTGSLINSGTAPSWPLFTITGPTDSGSLTMPSITDTATGQSIVYGGTLNVGDILVIDTNPATRSATLNGTVDVWSGIQVSQWFQVPAMDQVKVQFQGVSGSLTPAVVPVTPNAYF